MATQSTALLGLALPITGELDGTWGDTVNDSITSLLDSAIAGTTTLSADADVTLSTTALAADQARQAIILWTASGTVTRNITAPASSKTYIVINSTSGTQSIVIRGAGPTTGVTIPAGGRAIVAWNGSDFVKIVSNPTVLTTDVTGTLPVANGGTGQTTYTNGQLLIGNTTGNTLTKATLTAGSNVTITNGAGSITISASGGGGTTASGSVILTSASVTAQAITTTTYGQTVTLPDATTVTKGGILYNINNLGAYPLKIVNNAGSTLGFVFPNCPVTVGLADNVTAAGTWSLVGAEPYAPVALVFSTDLYNKTAAATARKTVVIDANRTLILLGNSTLYGIIYDASTLLWGTLTTIRSGSIDHFEAILSATDQVLVNSSDNAQMEAVVLTLSGTSITVGTQTIVTLSANNNGGATAGNLIAVGSSFVITYDTTTPALQMRAMTISGTTVTIGAATVLNGTTVTNVYISAVSSSVALVLTNTAASTFFATPYSVSGTTITLGTGATYASTTADVYQVRPISNGARTAVVLATGGTGNPMVGLIISVSGTTASISAATLSTGGTTAVSTFATIVSGSKLILLGGATSMRCNILTDTAGTASAGTSIGPLFSSTAVTPIPISANATTNLATFYVYTTAANVARVVLNFTGASPIVVDYDFQSGGTNNYPTPSALNYKQTFTPTLLIGASSYAWNGVVTGQRAVAIGENNFASFYAKFLPISTTANSITQNKVVVYVANYGSNNEYGTLQIIESVS